MTIFHVLKYGNSKNFREELPESVYIQLSNWYNSIGHSLNMKNENGEYYRARNKEIKKLLLEYDGPL